MPTQLPLVFDVPARGKAPRHWLDLSISERLAAMEAFGLPKFRADQISRHVFDGLSDDVTAWTDLPAAIRDDLKRQLFPALLTQVRRLTAAAPSKRCGGFMTAPCLSPCSCAIRAVPHCVSARRRAAGWPVPSARRGRED